MTQTQPAQPEALRLAAWLNEGAWHNITLGDVNAAGRELRRQHARIAELEKALRNRELELSLLESKAQLRESRKPLPVDFKGTEGINARLHYQRGWNAAQAAHGIGEKT